jgi:hydroxymethylbilane synthase
MTHEHAREQSTVSDDKNHASAHRPRRLGTRGSALARWQAEWVAGQLRSTHVDVELVFIQTGGDATTQSLQTVGGQGLFTREIQRALLDGRVDLAVHSLKDLPTDPVEGLILAAVPARESSGDVLVSRIAQRLDDLPPGARIGTGSRRRKCQLLHARPDLQVFDIRGNLDTRLRKLDEGQFDAIILAEAGLKRLGWGDRIRQVLPPEIMLPAAGQGALGIEIRADDSVTAGLIKTLDDAATRQAVLAERALLAELRAGCLAPVGVWGRITDGHLRLDAVVLSGNGTTRLAAFGNGPPEEPSALGARVARELLAQGAANLIAEARS